MVAVVGVLQKLFADLINYKPAQILEQKVHYNGTVPGFPFSSEYWN